MSPSKRHDAFWVLVAVGLAALALPATPPVYRALVDWGWLDPASSSGGDPFGKVLRRLLMVPAAACVLLGMRPWRDLGLLDVGLRGPRARPRAGLLAFGVTLAVALVVLALQAACGWLRFEVNESASRVGSRLALAALSATVVALIENWFFRAWLPLLTGRWFGARWADPVAVVLFAGAHAFRPSHLDAEVSHDTAGAWEALSTWLRTMFEPTVFGPTFLGLLLFGALLTLAYRRTGSLWVPIGIHAAGAFLILAYGGFTERLHTPAWAGTKLLCDGVPGWAVLLAGALLFARRPPPAPAAGPGGPAAAAP